MRYRPDAHTGDFFYTAFTPDPPMPGEEEVDVRARHIAQMFWERVGEADVSVEARRLAREMVVRCAQKISP
jgi:hypothetical protein